MGPLLFLLLPALASCTITVGIRSTKSLDHSIQLLGNDSRLVGEAERFAFHITDDVLKNAAKKHDGNKPAYIFLTDPTPWFKMFYGYSWSPVERILYPVKYEILNSETEQVFLDTAIFDNDRRYETLHSGIKTLKFSFNSTWYPTGSFPSRDPIPMAFSVQDNVVFNSTMGRDLAQTQFVRISKDLRLYPDEVEIIDAVMWATKVTLCLLIEYAEVLTGDAMIYYTSKNIMPEHIFEPTDINLLLQAAGIPTEVKSLQKVKIQYYANASIVMTDFKTKQVIQVLDDLAINVDDSSE